MGMMLLKIKYHIAAAIRIVFFKFIFGNKLKVGRGTTFRRFFNIYLEKNAEINIGENCFFNHGCSVNALEKVEIGNACIFGENVKIYDHNHRFSDSARDIKKQGFRTSPIRIGNHCWLGSNVVVLKGAHIGDNCVIGAGCIIDTIIPDNTIVKVKQEHICETLKH